MGTEQNSAMGDVTQTALNFISEDLLVSNEGLNPEDVLDFLNDEDNFKKLSDLLKETMVNSKIPKDVKRVLKTYNSFEFFLYDLRHNRIDPPALSIDDKSDMFSSALLALLSRQDEECRYNNRKSKWNLTTIKRWFKDSARDNDTDTTKSESIRIRDDAIAICFALGLDYPSSRDFLSKSGHALFNIRCPEDAVYIYCLINTRPFSVAGKLIHDYNTSLQASAAGTTENRHDPYPEDVTRLMTNQILNNFDWKNDDSFFSTFLLPNRINFTSYSNTTLMEYYKLKNPIYLTALKIRISASIEDFKQRQKQLYIHKSQPDYPVTVEFYQVQLTHNFINNLKKYSPASSILKGAKEMLKVNTYRVRPGGWSGSDFKVEENFSDTINFIKSKMYENFNNPQEMKILSDFLTDTVTAYHMLCTLLPSITEGDESKATDARQRAYSYSSLNESVLKSFPHRNFFTKYEKHPETLVHDMAIRKAIILLFYMNYAYNMLQTMNEPSDYEDVEFGFEDFFERLNALLGRCQLGKLYPANQFDWLILQSVRKLEDFNTDDYIDEDYPFAFLDQVLELSFENDDQVNDYPDE